MHGHIAAAEHAEIQSDGFDNWYFCVELHCRAAKRSADHTGYDARGSHGIFGLKAGLTPNLDELAKRSVVFTRGYAVVH